MTPDERVVAWFGTYERQNAAVGRRVTMAGFLAEPPEVLAAVRRAHADGLRVEALLCSVGLDLIGQAEDGDAEAAEALTFLGLHT